MTAKEFLNTKRVNMKGSDSPYDQFSRYQIQDFLVEFAKYHVQEALKAASVEADITQDMGSSGNWFDCVDKDSILNAYSLENIK